MKIRPACLLLLVPIAFHAAVPLAGERAESYWRVSNLLESSATSASGEPLGDVEDIVFGDAGEIYAVLINRDPAATGTAEAEPAEDSGRRNMYEEMFAASFEDVRFAPQDSELRVTEELRRDYREDDRKDPLVGRFHASEIIGATVNLADDDGFGKVVDILVSPGSSQAYGFVVETGVFNGDTYLLPPDFAAFDRDSREMNFATSRGDIRKE